MRVSIISINIHRITLENNPIVLMRLFETLFCLIMSNWNNIIPTKFIRCQFYFIYILFHNISINWSSYPDWNDDVSETSYVTYWIWNILI